MRKILFFILRIFTQLILWQYHPVVIGITGSIGKTSAKEAIVAILSQFMPTRGSFKNYNNNIGLPLSVIGVENNGGNFIKWFGIFGRATWLSLRLVKHYPRVLVLEMGADRQGDLKYLTKITKPRVSIVTAVAPAHLEWFKNLAGVKREKQVIIQALPKDGLVILNGDDSLVRAMAEVTKARAVTYGFKDGNTFQAKDWQLTEKNGQIGMVFKLLYAGSIVPVFLPNILGWQQIMAVLPAVALAVAYFKIPLFEAVKALAGYRAPCGRTNLIAGRQETKIIDDTYNSSPEAAKAALELLADFQKRFTGRTIAVLGEMYELGDFTQVGHKEVGVKAAAIKVDCLVTIGLLTEYIDEGAGLGGLAPSNLHHFVSQTGAIEFLLDYIKPGDTLLIKGSQGARMERITKALMAEPSQAKKLLVRQEDSWLKK
ncbi:MAG: Mur ligase family protein [Candidatus Komeilibacteria bacterium]|nr:Mur ligase family protein [Candidatus Komeilibacteria bacterium]